MQDINITMRLICQLQSIIHTMDELSDTVRFKQALKQRTNSYLLVIEGVTNELADAMGMDELDNYGEIVSELDQLASTIVVVAE